MIIFSDRSLIKTHTLTQVMAFSNKTSKHTSSKNMHMQIKEYKRAKVFKDGSLKNMTVIFFFSQAFTLVSTQSIRFMFYTLIF